MNPLVVVVVLNWNLPEDTIACVTSVLQSTYSRHQCVIVDNGSDEVCISQIRAELPAIPLLKTKANLGYAGGNNIGIQYALENGADYVLILNNDASVDKTCISTLVQVAEDDGAYGILSPAIYYATDTERFWRLGAVEKWWLPIPSEIGRDQNDFGQYPSVFDADFVTGCAMFVRSELFFDVGLLDTGYFMYYEDADFCQRVRDRGSRIAVVPKAHVWHKVSRSSHKRIPVAEYYRTRNRIIFYNRYWRGYKKLTINGYVLARAFWKLLQSWRDQDFVLFLLRGLRDGYAQVTGKSVYSV